MLALPDAEKAFADFDAECNVIPSARVCIINFNFVKVKLLYPKFILGGLGDGKAR